MTLHLAEPVEVFPDCRLWLASFDHERSASFVNTESDIEKAMLTNRDLIRWQQFRPAEKKQQFLNSRLAVRTVLQREFADEAEDIQFDSDSHGCPILTSLNGKSRAQISLSHSGNAIAVLISNSEFPIGVDIEVDQPLHSNGLRMVALHPHEQSWCDGQTGREFDALLTLWTVKESVWKTLRSEIEIPVAGISVDFDRGDLTPCVLDSSFYDAMFRSQLFVVQCENVTPETLLLPPLGNCGTALRGCVTQRTKVSCGGPQVEATSAL
jgi:4'-phosphopantetheinyl transferase